MSEKAGSLMQRMAGLGTTSFRDASDALRVLPGGIHPLQRAPRLVGRAITADARADLLSVLAALELGGANDVLVIAGGSSDRAVLGELFATEAVRRGMAGIVIDGLCRDVESLVTLPIPVYARGATPVAASANRSPRVQVPVAIGDVTVRPGDLIVGDDDGIVVGSDSDFGEALERATAIDERDAGLRAAIQSGDSLFSHLNLRRHVAALQAGQSSALELD